MIAALLLVSNQQQQSPLYTHHTFRNFPSLRIAFRSIDWSFACFEHHTCLPTLGRYAKPHLHQDKSPRQCPRPAPALHSLPFHFSEANDFVQSRVLTNCCFCSSSTRSGLRCYLSRGLSLRVSCFVASCFIASCFIASCSWFLTTTCLPSQLNERVFDSICTQPTRCMVDSHLRASRVELKLQTEVFNSLIRKTIDPE